MAEHAFYARFELVHGQLFRFDTRIYLESRVVSGPEICVGAIVGKNPGSARPTKLGQLLPLELKGDKMLPTVRNRFKEAYGTLGKPIPVNAFVRVWNLFYLCNANLGEALRTAALLPTLPTCGSENDALPLVWYAWGGADSRLDVFKTRFESRTEECQFFYDHRSATIRDRSPDAVDFAKHTQGMPGGAVTTRLASALRPV